MSRDKHQLIDDNGRSDRGNSHDSSRVKDYEPPPAFTAKITVTDNSSGSSNSSVNGNISVNDNSIVNGNSDGNDTTESIVTNPQQVSREPSLESPRPGHGNNGTDIRNATQNDVSDSGIVVVDAATNEPKSTGCFSCVAVESFEIEYDRNRFGRIENKTNAVSKRISFFSHRWWSYRDNLLANHHGERQWNPDDERTLSSGDSSKSYGYYNDDDEDTQDDRFTGIYQHFHHSLHRKQGNRKQSRKPDEMRNRDKPGAMEIDTESLATRNPCNEYARMQLAVWKSASIEGPRFIKVASLLLALTLLLSSTGMAYAANRDGFWTPGTVVACCHLVVTALVILLLESRPSLTGHGILRDIFLVVCCCSKTVDDEMTDFHGGVLPMDVYREYRGRHSDDCAAKPRDDFVQTLLFFRYLYGRGFLCIYAGSMAFAVILGHFEDYPGAFLAVGVPGIGLLLVGVSAVLAGLHASFRWTLLETSIVGDDDYLLKKFLSAGQIDDESDDETRLNRHGFSVLVTTLGLDLDEINLVPTVFALEVKPKIPDAMTFEEFRRWWRGRDVGLPERPRWQVRREEREEKDSLACSTLSSLASYV